ncbi:uncharacterized protein N7482_003538 [Penicillium canariense]|uniref:Uncharacterized protein n=1 Tax=Penicillium canariense TaxID=189055 RepID=A0A9W9I771_9EURO|nr:uncharacterized protein N7482_003538 [Penicillium canariense]KAJ5167944.1 hypothetical protein N7482_003538 [Penicillium canariense]
MPRPDDGLRKVTKGPQYGKNSQEEPVRGMTSSVVCWEDQLPGSAYQRAGSVASTNHLQIAPTTGLIGHGGVGLASKPSPVPMASPAKPPHPQ